MIAVDPGSSIPIYAQIVESVERLVATGRLRPGAQLPTVRQLAVDLRVNANTIARAYLELDRRGVISSQQGRGTYVSDRPDAIALTRRRQDKLRAMVSSLLLEALSQGYAADDLREAVEREILHWKTQHAEEKGEGTE